MLTGGNYVRCAFKHKDMFSYRPQYKVWLVSNHKLNGDPDDDAMWGRVQVHYLPSLPPWRRGCHTESPAPDSRQPPRRLRWIVEGARRWYQIGARLMPPDSVSQATTKQRDDQDYVKQWIEDCCLLDPDDGLPALP